jgi:hypothetical protein
MNHHSMLRGIRERERREYVALSRGTTTVVRTGAATLAATLKRSLPKPSPTTF